MSLDKKTYQAFPAFKGLQRPFEMLGFQGRYIIWAVITAGAGVLGFFICFAVAGFLVGLIYVVVVFGVGGGLIFIRQKKGLHSKKTPKGLFIYKHSRSL